MGNLAARLRTRTASMTVHPGTRLVGSTLIAGLLAELWLSVATDNSTAGTGFAAGCGIYLAVRLFDRVAQR